MTTVPSPYPPPDRRVTEDQLNVDHGPTLPYTVNWLVCVDASNVRKGTKVMDRVAAILGEEVPLRQPELDLNTWRNLHTIADGQTVGDY